jgi:hypothetical protein
VDSNEDMIIALTKVGEAVEVYTVSADSALVSAQNIQAQGAASSATSAAYEWITEYYNGSTHLTNITITVILAEIAYLASYINPVAGQ